MKEEYRNIRLVMEHKVAALLEERRILRSRVRGILHHVSRTDHPDGVRSAPLPQRSDVPGGVRPPRPWGGAWRVSHPGKPEGTP